MSDDNREARLAAARVALDNGATYEELIEAHQLTHQDMLRLWTPEGCTQCGRPW